MSDQGTLFDVASELLAASVAVLDTTPSGAPSNQYVSHGLPAYDCCDTITVHAGLIDYASLSSRGLGATTTVTQRRQLMPEVGLTITALRCQNAQPTGGMQITLPTIAQVQADAEAVFADGWALFNGLNQAYRDNTLFEGYPCRIATIEPCIPIAPEGGCLGWTLLVVVQLDGYTPV